MHKEEHKDIEHHFKTNLHNKIPNLRQRNIEECDFMLFFCFIVSRTGTDIKAAVDEFNSHHSNQAHKPAILVVLHHTFDKEKFIPDSNAAVNNEQILAVDCLFNEDEGFLQCQKNEDAFQHLEKYLKSKNLSSYGNLKDQDGETWPLLNSMEISLCQKYRMRIILVCVVAFLLALSLFLLVFYL